MLLTKLLVLDSNNLFLLILQCSLFSLDLKFLYGKKNFHTFTDHIQNFTVIVNESILFLLNALGTYNHVSAWQT